MLAEWAAQRPDIDVSAQGVVGRILRLSRVFERELASVFEQFGINGGEFDVLATLRRTDEPDGLTASGLASRCMLSSAAMTNRLDRLEATGLVRRLPDRADRRVVRTSLTPPGRRLIDEVFPLHARNQDRMLMMLSNEERDLAASLLARILTAYESAAEPVRGSGLPPQPPSAV
jgi:DNA-binding MarR family transcriptional regulator